MTSVCAKFITKTNLKQQQQNNKQKRTMGPYLLVLASLRYNCHIGKTLELTSECRIDVESMLIRESLPSGLAVYLKQSS